MKRFIIRRLLFSVTSVLAATLILFALSHLSTDPRYLYIPESGAGISEEEWDRLGERFGFDKPFIVQYFVWLGNALQGDLGNSLAQMRPVTSILVSKWGATLQLALGGWLFAMLGGVPLGILAAVKRGTVWDYFGRGIALFGQSLPSFWVGIMLIFIFAVQFNILPSGTKPDNIDIRYYILPSITLGWLAMAVIARLTRSAMLEVLDSEYIKLARAKGVSGRNIIWKHALRNAIIVPLTAALVLLGFFVTGSFVTEIVFSWPGIAYSALYRAVFDNDYPLLMGAVLFYVLLYVGLAFIADVLYAIIDPRIRYD